MDWNGFDYDFRKRWRHFCGEGCGPLGWCMRAAVFLFAVWTMSAGQGQDHRMNLGIWILLVVFYYFYL